jgi:hypothetical protein
MMPPLAPPPGPQPANIFIDGALNAKLGDVGLAAAAREDWTGEGAVRSQPGGGCC